ncbi:streptophobe family protein [Streptomyces echinoruber]|uniref:Integral membrane protein n=1 Tax=Streptomyces echinoruber TaxID=68898 RepID=A0A918VS45_9ACTN|nr:streptophobe family protein [Streptomyces echinoruber]GHA18216.1 hypothetical protein GCM10010389_65380 [Streptomyces echinoruber]
MGLAAHTGTAKDGGRPAGLPWADLVLSAIAAVSWALIGMAGTAALGLHLLRADTAGSLGPMTAAVVALGAGGTVTPSGDMSAFGLKGAEAHTAVEIAPLGVSLVGTLVLSWFFLRSLRAAGAGVRPAELLARAGAVAALFVAVLGGLAWVGHDVVTIDGGALGALGLDRRLPGTGGSAGPRIPGLGDLGDLGGLLPQRIGDLVDAKARVGFAVDTGPTLLGGLCWVTGVLLIALLASRRTPLPRGWRAVHRGVRPAVSALVAVLLLAVAAGLVAAAYAALGDDHPRRVVGAALLGAPNGTWLGVSIGLLVPWDGSASGALTASLPHPLDELLRAGSTRPVTLGRLADLDGRVWLLGVGAGLLMLVAGVLTAVRTPVGAAARQAGATRRADATQRMGAARFAGRCAVALGAATAVALPLLARLAEVSASASLSVFGLDAFGAGVELRGHPGTALLLGAVWGAAAGAAGALLARAVGAAGRRAVPAAVSPPAGVRAPAGVRTLRPEGVGAAGVGAAGVGAEGVGAEGVGAEGVGAASAGAAGAARRSGDADWGRRAGSPPDRNAHGEPGDGPHSDRNTHGERGDGPRPGGGEDAGDRNGHGGHGAGSPPVQQPPGPYAPGRPYRPPNPATNPYLRVPEDAPEPVDAPPPSGGQEAPDAGGTPPDDVYGAPTVARPLGLPPRRPPSRPRPRPPEEWPPPPPPPPPPPSPPSGGRG